jgi:DNA-directed RNA polymerase specialized sigma24 family protein
MSEQRENASRILVEPAAKRIGTIALRVQVKLEEHWFDPITIAALLDGGLPAVSRIDPLELQDSQIITLHAHRPELVGFFVNRGCDPEEADERADGCLVKMTEAIRGGTILHDPKAFAFRVARGYNHDENERSRIRVIFLAQHAAVAVEASELTPADEASLAELAEQDARREEAFYAGLDAEEKRLLELLQEDFTHEEICQTTGWDESQYGRVQKSLRRMGKKFGVTIPRTNRKKRAMRNEIVDQGDRKSCSSIS